MSLAAAVAVVAGAVTAVFPQHAGSLVVLGAGVIAAVFALGSVAAIGSIGDLELGDRSAGKATSPVPPLDPQGLRDARRELASGRFPMAFRGLVPESRWRAEMAWARDTRDRTAVVHRLLDELTGDDREVGT